MVPLTVFQPDSSENAISNGELDGCHATQRKIHAETTIPVRADDTSLPTRYESHDADIIIDRRRIHRSSTYRDTTATWRKRVEQRKHR